jgi:hypothetical protein
VSVFHQQKKLRSKRGKNQYDISVLVSRICTAVPVTVEDHLTLDPLNAELNPIRHLLTLVGARHIVHVSRIRVNMHTLIEADGLLPFQNITLFYPIVSVQNT